MTGCGFGSDSHVYRGSDRNYTWIVRFGADRTGGNGIPPRYEIAKRETSVSAGDCFCRKAKPSDRRGNDADSRRRSAIRRKDSAGQDPVSAERRRNLCPKHQGEDEIRHIRRIVQASPHYG
jgi:hypothetical protein